MVVAIGVIVPPPASRRIARPWTTRASATAAGLALLLAALAAPAQATPTRLVVLDVKDQSGTAVLEWAFAPGLGAPSVDAWVVTKWTDGVSEEITLPGSASSYTDTEVEPGRTYVYTVTYEEQGLRAPPSNPVVFSADCFFIFKCNPFEVFPTMLGCLFMPCPD